MNWEHENILEMILDEIQAENRKLSRIEQQNNEILAIVSEQPQIAQSATLVITPN